MKIKDLKIRFASAALSMLMVSNAGLSLSSPAFAESDDLSNLEMEENLDLEDELLDYEDKKKKEEEEEEEVFDNYSDFSEEVSNYQEGYNNVESFGNEDFSSQEIVSQEEVPVEEPEVIEENSDEIIKNDENPIVFSTNLENEQEFNANEELGNKEIIEEDIQNNLENEIQDEVIDEITSDENKDDVVDKITSDENQDAVVDEITSDENQENKVDMIEQNSEELTDIQLDENLEQKLTKAIQEDQMKLEEQVSALALQNEEGDKTTTAENTTPQSAKVAIITTKVDEEGKPLVGATLQIVDSEGNVLDEWISDGSEHVSMIPEGNYILREKSAPEGYIAAADQPFNVKIEEKEVNAGVDHDDSHDVCWHYAGVALYFVESEGMKEEVYCINQNWEEPNGTNYDGMILNETNIRNFTPDADNDMTDTELYNKVLDIIYHRSLVEELFPELSETEIRFITEYALKTYTSAEGTTRQAKRDENGKLIRDEAGNLIYEDIPFLRYYKYDPTSPKGYVIDPENGDGIGKLAEHWYNQHNKTPLPPEYAALFYYLVSEENTHPDDMFLYIYSTKTTTEEGDSYQNLLGVRWFDPTEEEYKTYLTVVDEKKEVPPEKPDEPEKPDKPDKPDKPCKPDKPWRPDRPPCPPEYPVRCSRVPKTGDEANTLEDGLLLLSSAIGLGASATLLSMSFKKGKKKAKTL